MAFVRPKAISDLQGRTPAQKAFKERRFIVLTWVATLSAAFITSLTAQKEGRDTILTPYQNFMKRTIWDFFTSDVELTEKDLKGISSEAMDKKEKNTKRRFAERVE